MSKSSRHSQNVASNGSSKGISSSGRLSGTVNAKAEASEVSFTYLSHHSLQTNLNGKFWAVNFYLQPVLALNVNIYLFQYNSSTIANLYTAQSLS